MSAAEAPVAPERYSRLQIALHWTIAVLIVIQLVYNEPMQRAFGDRVAGDGLALGGGALVHMVLGSTVLVLAVIRLFVRARRGVPAPHAANPLLVTWAGHATHLALYVMIFAMPLTGLAAWFFGSEAAATYHEIGRLVIIVLIGLHILGALAEHFVFRNDAILRMLGASRPDASPRPAE